MKIKKVQVRNYLSYKDSGEMNVDKNLTVLVGKNESGKTNFLKSLETFNKDHTYSIENICEYCEAREEIERGLDAQNIDIVTIWFEVEEEDTKELEKIREAFVKIKGIKVTKYFDNHYGFEFQGTSKLEEMDEIMYAYDLPQEKAEQYRRKKKEELRVIIDDLSKNLSQHAKQHPPFASNKPTYSRYFDSLISTDFYNLSDIEQAFKTFYKNLRSLPTQSPEIQTDIENAIKSLEELEHELLDPKKPVFAQIVKLLPNLVYIRDVDLLIDNIKISNFFVNKSKYKALTNLEALVDLDVQQLRDKGVSERRRLSELASKKITEMINESWNQEDIRIKIGIDGDDLSIFVEDEKGAITDLPSKRSDGFQWYLSFYINFMAGSKGDFKNTVLLLDGPGMYLHPSGQKDLLQILETISENNQVIITTHSPFLIDRNKLNRVRLVLKKEYQQGSIIEEKFHVSEFDALEPIRAAIGMTLDDALFATKNNLLAEGYSDSLILEAMSFGLKRIQKNYLDVDNISIIPINGADKAPYFALFLEKEKLNYAVLLDYDDKGKKVARYLKEKCSINEGKIITLNAINQNEMEERDIEIEDLIDLSFYNKAVNEAYKEILEGKNITKIQLDDFNSSTQRIIKKYISFFEEKELGGFDKILVAKQIYNIVCDKSFKKEMLEETTIENFNILFQLINETISPKPDN